MLQYVCHIIGLAVNTLVFYDYHHEDLTDSNECASHSDIKTVISPFKCKNIIVLHFFKEYGRCLSTDVSRTIVLLF